MDGEGDVVDCWGWGVRRGGGGGGGGGVEVEGVREGDGGEGEAVGHDEGREVGNEDDVAVEDLRWER